MRRRLLGEEPSARQLARLSQARQDMVGRWVRMYVMAGAAPDHEPTPEKSIAAIAARGNASPQEVAYDYLTEGLDRFLFFPIVNYAAGDHATVREMPTDPGTLLGLSDFEGCPPLAPGAGIAMPSAAGETRLADAVDLRGNRRGPYAPKTHSQSPAAPAPRG